MQARGERKCETSGDVSRPLTVVTGPLTVVTGPYQERPTPSKHVHLPSEALAEVVML